MLMVMFAIPCHSARADGGKTGPHRGQTRQDGASAGGNMHSAIAATGATHDQLATTASSFPDVATTAVFPRRASSQIPQGYRTVGQSGSDSPHHSTYRYTGIV